MSNEAELEVKSNLRARLRTQLQQFHIEGGQATIGKENDGRRGKNDNNTLRGGRTQMSGMAQGSSG